MNAFEKRVKANELVAGMKLYPVFSVSGSVASKEKTIVVAEESKQTRQGSNMMVTTDGYSYYYGDNNLYLDPGVPQYNFHALFKSEEDATAAVLEINNGDLSPEMTAVRDRLVAKNQKDRDFADDQW